MTRSKISSADSIWRSRVTCTKTLSDSQKTVLYEFKKEAHGVNANTVFGVFLDYMELSTDDPMILMVASGTAVIVEDL